MHIPKTLRDRILDAVSGSNIETVSDDEHHWRSLDEKFARVVAAAEIASAAIPEEIGLNGTGNRNYLFSRISSDDEQNRLVDDLAQDAELGSEWDYRSWLERGVAVGKTVIAVKREGDRRYAGFAIVRATVEMDAYDLEDGEVPRVCMHIDLAACYVSPSLRNLGYGNALAWVRGAYADSVFSAVQEMPLVDRAAFEDLEFVVTIEGEAQSAGGARLLSKAASEILSAMEANAEHYGVAMPTMCDDIDYAEFGYDEGTDEDCRLDDALSSTPAP